jgi:hypothetical protein
MRFYMIKRMHLREHCSHAFSSARDAIGNAESGHDQCGSDD